MTIRHDVTVGTSDFLFLLFFFLSFLELQMNEWKQNPGLGTCAGEALAAPKKDWWWWWSEGEGYYYIS